MKFLLVTPEADAPSGGHLYNQHVAALTGCRVTSAERAAFHLEEPVVVDSLYLGRVTPPVPFVWLLHWLPDEVGGSPFDDALRRARGLIVTSHFMAGRLRARGFSNVSVCEPGLEARYLERNVTPRQPAHRVLTVANFEVRKGHEALLEALAQCAVPWKWELIGDSRRDPALAARFAARVRDLDLSRRVCVRGSCSPDDVFDAYSRADVFALFPTYEPYGMVFAEAVASGVPVVAPRVGEVPQIVADAGVLFDSLDDAPAAIDMAFLRGAELSVNALSRRARFLLWSDTSAAVTAAVARWLG